MGNTSRGHVLVVDDDDAVRFGVVRLLERSGFTTTEASTRQEALSRFSPTHHDLVLADFRLPDGDALELIEVIHDAGVPIVVLTGYGSIDLAVQAVRMGAENFLTKPVDPDRLVLQVTLLCERRRSGTYPVAPPRRESPPVSELKEKLERLKEIDCTVLVRGETGTGKTRLVRQLHEASRRAPKPFVDLNCAALSRELVDSELFGHERGAFTSAHATKVGMFEQADGGTLFLDEIGDIDLAVQAKVLKAIEEKRFRRIGSARESSVDVRIVAATHRDLKEAVKAGQFRADLYYRLSAVVITVPPLRDRAWEIPVLARELLLALAQAAGREAPELSEDAEAMLMAHSWPGNVRELKNVLERALHFARGAGLMASDLSIESAELDEVAHRSSTLRDVERVHIERALANHDNVSDAAKSLGISRSSMYLKLKAYDLAPPRGGPRVKAGSGRGT